MGSATSPHGIKGEVELRLLNPDFDESVLHDGASLWLYPVNEKSKLKPAGEQWKVAKLRLGNKAICLLEGIKDRTHLETLLPFEFYMERSDFPEADDGEFYLIDLIEAIVISEAGEKIGVLESFSDNGEQYLFNIRLVNGEVLTLPYVESFFPEIDVENKKIIMISPEFTE